METIIRELRELEEAIAADATNGMEGVAERAARSLEELDAAQEAEDILRHKRLRDEFAMAALPAVFDAADDGDGMRDIARRAYCMADAMVTERDR